MLQVIWLYKPRELWKEPASYIGVGEVFLSNHEADIPVESIYGKADVIPLEEYHKKEEVDEDTYYYRAMWDIYKKKLSPPEDQWMKVCVCKKIFNPDEVYIECEHCEDMYHYECFGLDS